MPNILVTRPSDQSVSFAKDLEFGGIEPKNIIIDPILRIDPVNVSFDFSKVRGVLITSQNTLNCLPTGLVGTNLPAYCVGRITTHMAAKCGLKARNLGKTAKEFGKSLNETLQKGPLVHLRGEFTTIDFVNYFTQSKLQIESVITYRQTKLDLKPKNQKLLRATKDFIIPLFSSRSAQHLCSMDLNWERHIAVVISESVAGHCKKGRFKKIIISHQPEARSMVGAVVSLKKKQLP